MPRGETIVAPPRPPIAIGLTIVASSVPKAAVVAATNGHGDWAALLTRLSKRTTVLEYTDADTIFMQGQPADSVYSSCAAR